MIELPAQTGELAERTGAAGPGVTVNVIAPLFVQFAPVFMATVYVTTKFPDAEGVKIAVSLLITVKPVVGFQPMKSPTYVAANVATELTQSGLTLLVILTGGKG